MKKLFLSLIVTVLLGLLFWTHPAGLNAQTPPTHDAVALRYHETMSKVKTEWADTTLSQRIRLKGENGIPKAYLYRVESEDRQQGYMVTMNIKGTIQISEATFSGEDALKDNHKNEYYIAPMQFMTRETYHDKVEDSHSEEAEPFLSTEKTEHQDLEPQFFWGSEPHDPENLVPVPDSYFSSYYVSYYSEIKVEETPEYFQHSNLLATCGPTTGAMFTSFFDRVALPDLIEGTLPLSHYTDSGDFDEEVDDHIYDIADYMGSWTGIDRQAAKEGLNNYFLDNGYSSYESYHSDVLSEYESLILEANPVYLRLKDESIDLYHAVLGIGIATPYGSEDKFIVRYNHTDKSGEYHVSVDLFNEFIFMSKG